MLVSCLGKSVPEAPLCAEQLGDEASVARLNFPFS